MIDIADLVAIDVHTHVIVGSGGEGDEPGGAAFRKDQQQRWKAEHLRFTPDETAAYYRGRRMACVIFPVDSESGLGEQRVPNLEVVEAAERNPDVLIPFASIDPWKGRMGVAEAERLITDHGIRGFKFHPSTQAFFPNDRHAYPLYEVIAQAGLPAIFHSGQTGLGRTMPGGGGIRLKYSNPLYLDDVAADFPDMPIIIAHPSFPWQSEALAVAHHKEKVHIDLSGWSPRYFAPELVHYANTLLRDKILFGSDFPLLTPDRWLADFEQAGFRDEVKPGILKDNAARLLGLSPG